MPATTRCAGTRLAEAATATIDAMMSGNLPDPIQLATDFGPLVEERRLLFWGANRDEQDFLQHLEIDGAIPKLSGGDGWAFTVANGVGNKIDSYLERRAHYESTATRGVTNGTLRIELTNTAPADGLSQYIIGGGRVGLPQGTSRLYLSVYSALALDSITVNGEHVGVDAGVEQGWNVYSLFVDIASGETVGWRRTSRRPSGIRTRWSPGCSRWRARWKSWPTDFAGDRVQATVGADSSVTDVEGDGPLMRLVLPPYLTLMSRDVGSRALRRVAAGNQWLPAAPDAGQLAAGVSRPERLRNHWRLEGPPGGVARPRAGTSP